MAKRGPTDTDDRPIPPAEGGYEVVTADGERKPASLPKRMLAAGRDMLSMTDELPTWQPGELAPDLCPEGGTTMQCSLPKDHSGPHDYQLRPEPREADVQTEPAIQVHQGDLADLTGAPDPATPPQATLVAYQQQHTENTRRVAEQTSRRTAQLVTMDQHARARVYDISRLIALAALGNEAAAQLQADGWANVSPTLIGEFAAEIDGWKQDRGIG